MKRVLSILFLLWVTGGLYAQFIPGVVASSKKVEDEEGPVEYVFNGDFALGDDGWNTNTMGYGTWVIDVGSATLTGGNGELYQYGETRVPEIQTSTAYKLTIICSSNRSPVLIQILSGTLDAQFVAHTDYTPGEIIVYFTTPASIGAMRGLGVRVNFYLSSSDYFTFDSISLIEDDR